MKTDLEYGDRLVAVAIEFPNPASPTGIDQSSYYAGKHGIREITVGRIPGPEAYVLTAQITFEDHRPDIIVPLYKAARIEVQYGD